MTNIIVRNVDLNERGWVVCEAAREENISHYTATLSALIPKPLLFLTHKTYTAIKNNNN